MISKVEFTTTRIQSVLQLMATNKNKLQKLYWFLRTETIFVHRQAAKAAI